MNVAKKKIVLGDLCAIIDCEHKTAPTEEFGLPLIRTPNIGTGRLILENVQRISENTYRLWTRRGEPKPGDLIMAREAPVGNVAIVPNDEKVCLGQRTVLIRVKDVGVDANYLNYLLNSSAMNTYLNLISNGATVGHLNVTDIRRLSLPTLPNKSNQRKIAAVLSAFDNLIENNQRRIALLEKMAEEIYREWFVRLRFPGHKMMKIVKGIPEGWSFDKASMFFSLAKGKSYAAEELTDDEEQMPFVNLKSFNRGGGYREDGLKYYSGRYRPEQVVYQNDVVMAVTDMTQDRAVIGRVARMPDLGEKGAVISLDTVKLVPKNIHKTFLYAYMRHSGFANFIKEFANGANVLHLKPDLITQQKIIIPPIQLQNKFVPIAEPLYAEADLLGKVNTQLAKMRDMLLPRLISGKLSVEHLDIQFPPGMEDRP